MKIVEAPNEDYSVGTEVFNTKVFLAGGITNCPDWQSELIELTKKKLHGIYDNLTIYNPRRESFPINDPAAAEQQIVWEYVHLRDSDIIVFWFSKGSDNPIVLYELGMWCNSRDNKIVILGVDPEYSRKKDVEIQTNLAKPALSIYDNLDAIAEKIIRKKFTKVDFDWS